MAKPTPRKPDYAIAIPSYCRSEALAKKTLAYLNTTDVDPECINVFVVRDQIDEYKKALSGLKYKRIVEAPVGMGAVRRFISSYFREGQRLFCIDDDIKRLGYGHKGEKKLATVKKLDALIRLGFDECDKVGAGLWGIYPVFNAFFMKAEVTTDIRYCSGYCWGVVNTRALSMQVTLDDKEDFERTIKFYQRDGHVVRLNWVAGETAYFREKGGMQVERTDKRQWESVQYLLQKYPHLTRFNMKGRSAKGGNRPEIVLVDKTMEYLHAT